MDQTLQFNIRVQVFIWVLVCICAAAIFFRVGYTKGSTDTVDRAAATRHYREIVNSDKKYQRTLKKIRENGARLARLDKFDRELRTLKSRIIDAKSNLRETNSSLSKKRSELTKLTNQLTEVRHQPINLSAGHYIGGSDISPGRYAVTGSSNFIVRDISGSAKVNIILGGLFGVKRYVFRLKEGDQIQAESEVKLYPL